MWLLLNIFLFFICSSVGASEEEKWCRRVRAHILLHDYPSAVIEAKHILKLNSNCQAHHENYIRTLALVGDEREMLQAWDRYEKQFNSNGSQSDLIEEMAWGVLVKASKSSSLVMRQVALLAAFFSRDMKGVTLLYRGLHDSNYAIRAIAVKLSSYFYDHKLIEKIKQLFKTEKVWSVRQNILEAIGSMKIRETQKDLEALISSDETSQAEKVLAIAAWVQLFDFVKRSELERLALSNRAGLRQLACEVIVYHQAVQDIDLLIQLANDSQTEVKWTALQALGQITPPEANEAVLNMARRGVKDLNFKVALSAAWLLTPYSPKEAEAVFTHYLNDSNSEVRHLAAAVLSATGSYGSDVMYRLFCTHDDPLVRLNLALGLIGQRHCVEKASLYLKEWIKNEKGIWREERVGLFKAIVNRSSTSSPNLETENQLLRLELLNLLAMLKVPETQEIIREYLLARTLEIPITATVLLLTEGDEQAIAIVQQLLKDNQPRVRLQAALILSIWSREETPLKVLEEEYAECNWEWKSRILEGLGRIGSRHSVPFLINTLKEPSQTLRVIGALALIQCLNH